MTIVYTISLSLGNRQIYKYHRPPSFFTLMAQYIMDPYQARVHARLLELDLPSRASVEQSQQSARLCRGWWNDADTDPILTPRERWELSCSWQRWWNSLADQERRITEIEGIVRRAMDEEEALANGNI